MNSDGPTTEEMVNRAIRLITVFMVESKFATMRADTFSDGSFYVLNISIRKVEEDEE